MAQAFTKLTATAAPIMRTNVDTDVIISINRMIGNSVRGSLGKWAFGSLRYLPDGSDTRRSSSTASLIVPRRFW